jgi:hypothetical protein
MHHLINKRHLLSVLAAFVAVTAFLVACNVNTESYAYIHDPETEIIALSDNGKAVYKGNGYTYTKDESFIYLKGKDGETIQLRYIPNEKDDGMILYEKSTYVYSGDDEPDGIVGVWKQDNGWEYQFTENGTFSEENIFFGHYAVDEKASTIKLMYDDPIEDAILYYSLDGNNLTIDYPWPMVRTGSQNK